MSERTFKGPSAPKAEVDHLPALPMLSLSQLPWLKVDNLQNEGQLQSTPHSFSKRVSESCFTIDQNPSITSYSMANCVATSNTSTSNMQGCTDQSSGLFAAGSSAERMNSTSLSIRCMEVEAEEAVQDELQAMLHREATSYDERFDYLSFAATSAAMDADEDEHLPEPPTGEEICEGWRRKIGEWCFQVVDHFEFDRDVVAIALHYLDRVVSIRTLSSGEKINRQEFKLIAVASFYLALKLHGDTAFATDGQRKKLKIGSFVDLSRGLFSIDTLQAKEREILELLEWKVNPTTSVGFVNILLKLMPSWEKIDAQKASTGHSIFEMARYLTELAVCDSAFSFNYRCSEIAYAAILCAMEGLHGKIVLPYAVQVQLLNRITLATGLCPQSIGALCDELKSLCPTLFSTKAVDVATAVETEDRFDGAISPVSTMDV